MMVVRFPNATKPKSCTLKFRLRRFFFGNPLQELVGSTGIDVFANGCILWVGQLDGQINVNDSVLDTQNMSQKLMFRNMDVWFDTATNSLAHYLHWVWKEKRESKSGNLLHVISSKTEATRVFVKLSLA